MEGEKILKFKEYYTYIVYENGDVYSTKRNRFLKGEITRYGYLVYSLHIDKKYKKIRANRLVAYLFLDTPSNYKELVVNHKDGNKLNNHYSNLEWCTYHYNNYHARINGLNNISMSNSERWKDDDFRARTSKRISSAIIESGSSKGENNGRFRYEIYDNRGKIFNRTELSELLGLSQSYTDSLIKKSAEGKKNKYFDKYRIYVKDIKGKVNRLSKATDNEKNVAK